MVQSSSFWIKRGANVRTANVLVAAGCDSIAKLRAMTPETAARLPNVGKRTLADIARLAGWPSPAEPPLPPAKRRVSAPGVEMPSVSVGYLVLPFLRGAAKAGESYQSGVVDALDIVEALVISQPGPAATEAIQKLRAAMQAARITATKA